MKNENHYHALYIRTIIHIMVIVDTIQVAKEKNVQESDVSDPLDSAIIRVNLLIDMYQRRNGQHKQLSFAQYAELYLSQALGELPEIAPLLQMLIQLRELQIHPIESITRSSFIYTFVNLPSLLAAHNVPAERAITLIWEMSLAYYQVVQPINPGELPEILSKTISWYLAMYKNEMQRKKKPLNVDDNQLAAMAISRIEQLPINRISSTELKEHLKYKLQRDTVYFQPT